jgi:flagellar biosynthesis protein FlhB
VADTDSERTEEPTPERRRKAREEGQFPRAKDAGNIAASVFVMLVLAGLGDSITRELGNFTARCFSQPFALSSGSPTALLNHLAGVFALIVLPVAVAAALGGLALGVAEAGYHPNMDLAAPKWERLNPLPKLKQMFMLQETAVDVTLQLARVVIVGVVAYNCVESSFPRLMQLSRVDVQTGANEIVGALFDLALGSSLALAALALVDYLKSYRKHEASIRMSRQELKEEMKQQEGDHRIKQRQRARAREVLKRGMAKAVASSDFVVTNPTHISVALRYRVHEGAPTVTAKGFDEVALYIRKLAKEHDIPIIENKPLARALAKRVRPGKPVPVDLYAAVAEILAFVYRIKKKSIESLTAQRARSNRREAAASRGNRAQPGEQR